MAIYEWNIHENPSLNEGLDRKIPTKSLKIASGHPKNHACSFSPPIFWEFSPPPTQRYLPGRARPRLRISRASAGSTHAVLDPGHAASATPPLKPGKDVAGNVGEAKRGEEKTGG